MKNKRKTLEKTLKPHWVWAIALGSAVGWGAFVQPVSWMETAGPLGVIIGFSAGALLMMLIAVSYGFMIRKFPVSGGEFAYAFIGLGRTHAFVSGWFLTLGYVCIVALNASALALMIKYLFPSVIETFHLYTIADWQVYGMEIVIATIALTVFGYMNIRGTGLTGRMQFVFATIMVLVVVGLSLSVGISPEATVENVQPYFPENKTTIAAILSIVAIAPWAFVGFDAVPQAAEEFNFPARKAFMLIILAIFFSAVIYSLMILTTSLGVSWEQTLNENHLWGTAHVVRTLFGPIGLLVLTVALTMGIFTGLNGFVMASSRLLFAMARAKIIPKPFAKLHPKYQTPYIAVIFTIILSAIAPWFGREALTWVVDMSSIGVSIGYMYTCMAAFLHFKWTPEEVTDPAKQEVSPKNKIISMIGVLASICFIFLLLIPGSPAFLGIESRISLMIWIAIGLLFYLFKRKEFQQIPEEELEFFILGED